MKSGYRTFALLTTIAILLTVESPHHRAEALQPPPPAKAAPVPAISLLGRMVGGVWKSQGKLKAEFRYEWRVPGEAIRAIGKAAIGSPQEFPMEALYGWDAAAKKAYYMDFHGKDTVYRGLVEAATDGNTLTGEFEGLIGDSGKYRFSDTLTDDDTLDAKMYAKNKAGEWVQVFAMVFKRSR